MRAGRLLVSDAARHLATAVQAAAVVFALGPAVLVLVLSFSADSIIFFPPRQWGLTQYVSLLRSPTWLHAVTKSFLIATPAALLAVAVAVPAVLSIHRARIAGWRTLELASLGPLVIPISTYAVALYVTFLHMGLLGTYVAVILAQAVVGLPLVVVIAGAAMRRLPGELEFVAMSLGASRARALVGITCRLLMPAFAAGFIFAFLTSFDDAVFVTFLGGPKQVTLSKEIFDSLRFAVDPVITAISTCLMIFTGLLVGLTIWLRRTH
jgi:ABC-type spermidine/putrescine transport system permease subunit II